VRDFSERRASRGAGGEVGVISAVIEAGRRIASLAEAA
jgi:hypothetical protein